LERNIEYSDKSLTNAEKNLDENKSKHEEMQFKCQKLREEMEKPEVGVISSQEQAELTS